MMLLYSIHLSDVPIVMQVLDIQNVCIKIYELKNMFRLNCIFSLYHLDPSGWLSASLLT